MAGGAKKVVSVKTLPPALQPLFSQEDVDEIHEIFHGFDTNGSEDLDQMELQVALQVLDVDIHAEEVEKMLEEADLDNNKRIDFNEFVAICAKARFPALGSTTLGSLVRSISVLECPKSLISRFTPEELDEVEQIFRGFDENGNGVLDEMELQVALQVLGVDIETSKMQALVAEIDKNGDSLVNFSEFCAMVAMSRDKSGELGHSSLGSLLHLEQVGAAAEPAGGGGGGGGGGGKSGGKSGGRVSPLPEASKGPEQLSPSDSGVRLLSLSSGTVGGVPGGSYRQFRHLRRLRPGPLPATKSPAASQRRASSIHPRITVLTLDRVLQHPEALVSMHEYCSSKFAEESLLFWLECEVFQNFDWKPQVPAARTTLKRLLGLADGVVEASAGRTLTDSSFRSSASGKSFNAARSAKGFLLAERALLKDSARIWREYLSNDAPTWVCLPSRLTAAIEKMVFRGEATRGMFRDAQRHVFRDMEKGLWGEFIRSRTEAQLQWLARATRHPAGKCENGESSLGPCPGDVDGINSSAERKARREAKKSSSPQSSKDASARGPPQRRGTDVALVKMMSLDGVDDVVREMSAIYSAAFATCNSIRTIGRFRRERLLRFKKIQSAGEEKGISGSSKFTLTGGGGGSKSAVADAQSANHGGAVIRQRLSNYAEDSPLGASSSRLEDQAPSSAKSRWFRGKKKIAKVNAVTAGAAS